MTTSPPPSGGELVTHSDVEVESQLTTIVYALSQNVQVVMDNMLKIISEIDQNSAGIIEGMEKSKNSAFHRKKTLEVEKDHFQKAACALLNMLNNPDVS